MQSAIRDFENALNFYLRDLDALTDAQILESAGGQARMPVDFTYEVATINRRIATRLRGETPPPAPEWTGWTVAPTEMQGKSAIVGLMKETGEELLSAARAVPDADAEKMVGPEGNERPAYGWVFFAQMHTMYHDAQLNLIQSLAGDNEMHWF